MQLLKALRQISGEAQLSFEGKLERLLTIGCNALSLDIGIVSRIENDMYTIIAATPAEELPKGTQFPLGDTYCAHTLLADDILAIHHTKHSPLGAHPCYQSFGLESYIGIPIFVNHSPYGTLNFSSAKPHNHAFNETDFQYMLLLAEWVGLEISRQESLSQLQTKQEEAHRQLVLHDQMSELAGVGTWEIDVRQGTVYWSDSLKRMHDLDVSFKPTLHNVYEFPKFEKDKEKIRSLFTEAIKNGKSFTYELAIQTAKGSIRWMRAQAKTVMENGKCKFIMGASLDITHQVQVMDELRAQRLEAENALAARSRFLANMSHEVRTPLNGVIGMLEILNKTKLNTKQQSITSVIKHSANNLLAVINDVLDYSKIDAGKLTLEHLPVHINGLTKHLSEVFSTLAEEKGLSFSLDDSATKDITVFSDPTRLMQVLNNLLNNAIKFTSQGQISMRTRALMQPHGRVLINIEVEDSGIGIDEKQQASIFSPFIQADTYTTREFGGTGLGLSIVAQIVHLMGGSIKVVSQANKGAKFIVKLSMPLVSTEHELSAAPAAEYSSANLSALRVLVVEDNVINQTVITEQLSALGITPELADNGAKALNLLETRAPKLDFDVILMDCQMPIMDGYTATRNIRALGGLFETLPIIALTAHALSEERAHCLANGMTDYLAKPVSIEQLACRLEQIESPNLGLKRH